MLAIVVSVIYVDDILIIGRNSMSIQHLLHSLGNEFALWDLGNLLYFLDIEVYHTFRGIILSQQKYIKDLLEKVGMTVCKSVQKPISICIKVGKYDATSFPDPTCYSQLMGGLQYLALAQLDIYIYIYIVVKKAYQYMQQLDETH